MTNNQLAENSVNQLLNSVRLARDNAERADNRIDRSFYHALTIALEELQERRKADSQPVGYFRRYDPDAEALISQCSKNADDSFPLYTHAQSEPITADVERDAQRYRFLRDKDAFGDDGEPGLATWDDLIELDMNEFDAAIDARMAHPSVDFLALDNALQKRERRRCKDRNCNKQIFGYSVDGLCEDCYTAISQQPAPVAQCPYPCGWDTLNKLAIQDAAFVARSLVAGEPATESIRQAAITNSDRLLKVISACCAAKLNGGKS